VQRFLTTATSQKISFMTYIYDCNSDSHSVCHTLAWVVKEEFAESEMKLFDHSSQGVECIEKGEIVINSASYPITIKSKIEGEIELSVEGEPVNVDEIISQLVAAYKVRKDRGGNTSNLKLKKRVS
jgi:hypothetical protein